MTKWFRRVYKELLKGTPAKLIRIYEDEKGQIHLCIDPLPHPDTKSIVFEEFLRK